jgi:hypothetical protein
MTNSSSAGTGVGAIPPALLEPGDAGLPNDAPEYARRLVDDVERAVPALVAIPAEASAKGPAPGKWSPREIIGHLIDSASNNHQRFVRMRDRDDLVVEGYAQDEWVIAQRYQETPWRELVSFWRLYNRHLARVICATPAADRDRPRARHNLDQRAYRQVPASQPASLGYFMSDYVDHLEHHVRQILG